MEILTKSEFRIRFEEISNQIKEGALFIHPTDTIYGISCDATNPNAVKRLREAKDRPELPLSVWVPSITWIRDNCVVDKNVEDWLKKLPGPYTLILRLKNKKAVAKEVIPNTDCLGVRIPDHWFNEIVSYLKFPIVTTSANRSGQAFMTSIEDLDEDFKERIAFVIYEGEKKARPSKIIDLTKGTIQER
ncbi:threonylcarbamoyl-AMP synthase [Candidatus Woesearchaeota archaeon CG_4_10_14_0_2_um_filter_33_13]|nr:MAG: threonylcarbamoyl-AMP synthase [Candidatus Woesearchaeota archaeon CG_4_10_14_0_2_um_filter_33_13]